MEKLKQIEWKDQNSHLFGLLSGVYLYEIRKAQWGESYQVHAYYKHFVTLPMCKTVDQAKGIAEEHFKEWVASLFENA